MKSKTRLQTIVITVLLAIGAIGGCGKDKDDTSVTITNVSYDPTREFYEEYNQIFQAYYEQKYGNQIRIVQSHGGSASQARSVVEGCNADVVTLALEHDITLIEKTGLIDEGWIEEFDKESAPYTSTIVFLVRKGNEKNIYDWEDLTREGIDVITPDPKSSGGACWNFLAAWCFGLEVYDSEEEVKSFVKAVYDNVSVMDSGARGATTTFVENGKGDVLIAWENEALTSMETYPDQFELVTPSVSILAQPSVAIVDDNANANHTQDVSREYLQYLYSEEAQRLIGRYGYRPTDEAVLQEFSDKFNLDMKLYTINDLGGWNAVYEKFFEDEAIFDQIMGY